MKREALEEKNAIGDEQALIKEHENKNICVEFCEFLCKNGAPI